MKINKVLLLLLTREMGPEYSLRLNPGVLGTVHFLWGGGGGGVCKKMAIEGGPSQKYKKKGGVRRNILVQLWIGIMFSYLKNLL